MRIQFIASVALSFSIMACGGQSTTGILIVDPSAFTGARVELSEEGGLGAFYTTQSVSYDSRTFGYARRRICQQPSCMAPLDTAGGKLASAATDSLFAIVLAQSPLVFKDDYGRTQGGADMLTYTLTIRSNDGPKTIIADDGTMPPQMRRIVAAVHAAIDAARK